MGRRSPDEFQVVRRAPLVVPPEYRLPAPGTPSPAQQSRSASNEAQTAVLGGLLVRPEAEPSAAEVALLEDLPGEVVPDIREIILTENTELTQLDESRFLFILDFQRRNMAAGSVDNPIDATVEASRLEEEGRSAKVVTRRVGTMIVQ